MALTSAMFTGLTGLNASQHRIDTIGDNIANINTTAFKSSRAMFENQFAITLANGTAPSATSGGTNPSQVGLGALLSTVQKNFQPGAIETTGVPTDLAVEGAGFFIVNATSDQQAYTRDGTFKLDADNILVNADGFEVQGYGIDDDFNIVADTLTNLEVPLGTLTAARQTTSLSLDGNLNASGPVATQGTMLESQAFVTGGGAAATADTLLTDVFDAATPDAALFAEGDVLTVAGATKGGRQLPEATFDVTADSTLGDFASFLQTTLGLNTDEAAGGSPGVRIGDADSGAEGALIVEGNLGEGHALAIELGDIRSTNESFLVPMRFTETQEASGESVVTSFIAYDSLGTPVQVNLTLTLDAKSSSGNTWRFYAESPDDTDVSAVLGTTGTVTFDNNGQVTAVENNTLLIDRADTGALTPMQVTLGFENVTGLTTAASTLVMTTQDGFSAGTLSSFSIGTDGVITGTFSNGLTRTLGQVVLATFTNPEGLVGGANNLYFVGANSGQPVIGAPGTLGAGRILGGALELSNVDLTREFIGLITASTAFSASGRVISTSNDLLNELLLIAR